MDIPSTRLAGARLLLGVALAGALLAGCGSSSGPAGGGPGGPGGSGDPPLNGACMVFPADNPWNRDVSGDPLDPNSNNYIASILQGSNQHLHADFGSNPTYGIPYAIVPDTQPKVPINIVLYPAESDPGPYPIPPNAPVEAGSDHHVLVLDRDNCILYEMFDGQYTGPGWQCGSGAIFNLKSDALRPDGWTSADAAGLPIFAGLVRYEEAVQQGAIRHAVRFTVHTTQYAFIHPATHRGVTNNPNDPPMGLRLRLKASYDISGFTGAAQVILIALKKYGMLVADNGSDWFITGAPDPRWDDTNLDQLKTVPGSAFEVVQSGPIIH